MFCWLLPKNEWTNLFCLLFYSSRQTNQICPFIFWENLQRANLLSVLSDLYQKFSLKLHNSKVLRHTGSVYSVSGTCYSGAVDRRVYVSVHILLCEKLNGRFSHDYLPKSKKPSFNAYVALKIKKQLTTNQPLINKNGGLDNFKIQHYNYCQWQFEKQGKICSLW